MSIEIVVMTSGWVLVGERISDTSLVNASVIRTWGTTKGLGELALNGPTKETILDKCGEVTLNEPAVLFRIACKPGLKW